MSLPVAWVDRIFDKLLLTYGRDFASRWEGLDIAAVKTDWCNELGVLHNCPSQIAHALANLPDKPPTVLEFRKIARNGPVEPREPVLSNREPTYLASQQQIAMELARLAPALRKPKKDPKQWAYDLIEWSRRDPRSVSSEPLRMAKRALESRFVTSEGEE